MSSAAALDAVHDLLAAVAIAERAAGRLEHCDLPEVRAWATSRAADLRRLLLETARRRAILETEEASEPCA